MENKMQNLKISGAGSASGGKYDEVRISGAGNVNGDIECNYFKSSGASEIKGNIITKLFEVSGASEVKGNLDAEEIKSSGASTIKGDVHTKKIKVSGACEIKGNLHGEEVELTGGISIKGDCEAEKFTVKGAFDIGGLLNAGSIEIYSNGRCKAKEIGGEKIDIRRGIYGGILSSVMKFMFSSFDYVTAEVIEGDDIYLEGTKAKVVRGNNVTIGKDCDIELVEYRVNLNVDNDAKVGERKKMEL